jgi:hypothetical protein
MAGRIRSIKPELLEDDKTANLSHEGWRCFVSLLLLADDYGNFRAHPALLEGAIFWGCPSSQGMAPLMRELAEAGLITTYTVRDQLYGHLNGWARHQRVDKPGKPRCPGPKEATNIGQIENSRESPESFRSGDRDLPEARAGLAPVASSPKRFAAPETHHKHRPDREFAGVSGIIPDGSPITDHRSPITDHDQRPGEREAPSLHGGSQHPIPLLPPSPTARARSAPTKLRKTALTDDWQPAPATVEKLKAELGVNPLPCVQPMVDWAMSKGERRADWDATFRNWVRREAGEGKLEPLPPKQRDLGIDPNDTSGPATEATKKLLRDEMARLTKRIDEDNARIAAAMGPAKKY